MDHLDPEDLKILASGVNLPKKKSKIGRVEKKALDSDNENCDDIILSQGGQKNKTIGRPMTTQKAIEKLEKEMKIMKRKHALEDKKEKEDEEGGGDGDEKHDKEKKHKKDKKHKHKSKHKSSKKKRKERKEENSGSGSA